MSSTCSHSPFAVGVLTALHSAGYLYRLINQNHDGLPQKAGMPQHVINEIHGAFHAPHNPVVPMSGSLRSDLFADLLDCEATADLTIAVGTSLCGMNADRVVSTPAEKSPRQALGSVIIGLQRTVLDSSATLRIFAHCDTVFELLARELVLEEHIPAARAPDEYFCPQVLSGTNDLNQRYVLQQIRYDAMGRRLGLLPTTPTVCGQPLDELLDLDLRVGAQLVITSGVHAGATGHVDGYDREGHPRCCFQIKLKRHCNFKVAYVMILGTWWLQAAVDGTVNRLPVMNIPAAHHNFASAQEVRTLCDTYK